MFTKISNFLGKYFYGCDTGVVRMDNAIPASFALGQVCGAITTLLIAWAC